MCTKTYLILQKRLEAETIDVSVQKEIVSEAERLDVKDKAVIVLCELLFKDPLKVQNVIKANRNLFLRVCSLLWCVVNIYPNIASFLQFTAENTKAQKYLIRGFELTIKEFPNELLPRVAPILKIFYDLDILDEKVIIDWASKVLFLTNFLATILLTATLNHF